MFGKKKWTCTGKDGKPHAERKIDYGNPCIDCDASSPPSPPSSGLGKWAVGGSVLLPVLGYGIYTLIPKHSPLPVPPSPSPIAKCPIFQASKSPERFSLGEKSLFQGDPNTDLNRGMTAFETGNFQEATKYFKNAVTAARTDPQPQIYYNNAQARLKAQTENNPCPVSIAVVVPSQGEMGKSTSAQEILRGVADVQKQFNERGGIGDRLLEVLIVNDGNEPTQSALVAEEISQDPNILAVIGHNSSESSQSAFPVYEKAGIAMISPTSTATNLSELNSKSKNQVFFRTVPSDATTAPALAKYIKENIKSQKVVIFYDSKSIYSQSLSQALEDTLTPVEVFNKIDIIPPNFDDQGVLEKNINETIGVDTVILLPSTESTSIAIRIIKQIHEKNNKIKFLGEDALYNPTTLREGDNSVEGLALVVPIAPSDAYAEKAQATWGGKINWRTVASYDAAQAIIQSLEKSNDPKNLKRQDILKTLGFITITTEMSDNSWKFNHGERQSNDNERQSGPYIVQVDRGAPRPQEVPFGFKTLHCGSSSEK